jgi:hypothetical protein
VDQTRQAVDEVTSLAVPPGSQLIEVHVAEMRQLFNSMDPSPFRQRDLDPDAEEFIVGWGREIPRNAKLALLVHLDQPAAASNAAALLQEAVREYFGARATEKTRDLHHLLRIGRMSLVIGLAFLAVLIILGDLIAGAMGGLRLAQVLRESLLIGGWVAMWRPLEIFLYEWWPIWAEVRLYRRLSAMPVRIAYGDDPEREAKIR